MEFKAWPKITRLENKRPPIFTEKIDGTNACIVIEIVPYPTHARPDDCVAVLDCSDSTAFIYAQSRSRLITPSNDNFGFAKWVEANAENLIQLGEGYHYGEWWGLGIQRGYDLKEKRFSLFNTRRWNPLNPNKPDCCHVVPILPEQITSPEQAIDFIKSNGSLAAPGYMKVEGLVMYEPDTDTMFKIIIDK